MKIGLLLLGLLLGSVVAQAQSIPASGSTLASFIPFGYQLLGDRRATGDLNGDKRADVVLALTSIEERARHPERGLPPRLLLVLWRTASGYQLAVVARQLLLHNHSGINGDDPVSSLAIQRGVLFVNYDVGGNCGYSTTAKFRYQQKQFYLIGQRKIVCSHRPPDCDKLPYPAGYQYRDTNYLTGDYEVIETSDECRLLQHKRGRQPVRPLQMLADYKPAS